jgi:hypothetical protein
MHRVLCSAGDEAVLDEVLAEVREMTSAFPLVADPQSFVDVEVRV